MIDHGKGRPPYETKNAQVLTNEVKLLTPRCKYTILSGMGKCSDVMKMTRRTFFYLKIVSNSTYPNSYEWRWLQLIVADCCAVADLQADGEAGCLELWVMVIVFVMVVVCG